MRPRGGPRAAAGRLLALAAVAAVALAACATSSGSPLPGSVAPSDQALGSALPSEGLGPVIGPPGSASVVFAPNPAALVVGLDPGHGGCLDWGVPNPYDSRVERSEKALTLALGLALRERLMADGVTVVMTRDADVALAGDLYPDLGCYGEGFRDVNGDGVAGFGSDVPDQTRTRDELSAHIDLVNLARADVLLSIHINSLTENGVVFEVAATETFWTDETPWGPSSGRLATLVQGEVVAALAGVAPYPRQDRGIDAVNFYIIAPSSPDGAPSQPRRGIQMPGVLAEVGSMSLAAEADLLAEVGGRDAIATGLMSALAAWFAERDHAVRIDLDLPGGRAGVDPSPRPGSGPPYWAPALPAEAFEAPIRMTLTNTGQRMLPAASRLVVGWAASDEPYLALPPPLTAIGPVLPMLPPGASVQVVITLPPPPSAGRAVAWITVRAGTTILSDLGVPAAQLAVGE